MLAKLIGLALVGVTTHKNSNDYSFPNVYGFLNLLVRLQGKMCQ